MILAGLMNQYHGSITSMQMSLCTISCRSTIRTRRKEKAFPTIPTIRFYCQRKSLFTEKILTLGGVHRIGEHIQVSTIPSTRIPIQVLGAMI